MITLQHNWKTYEWIGDKWGEFKISSIDCPVQIVHLSSYWEDFCTCHTPEQLVQLWYMREVDKPIEWTPTPWETILVSNDWKEWKEREFVCTDKIYGDNLYVVKNRWHEETMESDEIGFYYAKPIQETPDIIRDFSSEPPRWLMQSDPTLYEQVALLTRVVQSLQRDKNNPK